MSHEATEVCLEYSPSPVTWCGCTTPGIASPNRDSGGSGDRNITPEMFCFRPPHGRIFLERAFHPDRASRASRAEPAEPAKHAAEWESRLS